MPASEPPPYRYRQRGEQLRRQIYLLLASLITALLSGVAIYGHWHPHVLQLDGWAWYGAGLCMLLVAVLASQRVNIHIIDQGVLASATLLVLTQLTQAYHRSSGLSAHLYASCLFIGIAAFAVLPVRGALLYGGLMLTLLLGLLAHSGTQNLTPLVDTAIALLLVGHVSIFGRQITAERTEREVYETLALTDTLTGLANRRAMYTRLNLAFGNSSSAAGAALLLLDADHFKRVNDEHGHQVGDEVLKRLAEVLQQQIQGKGMVARWGGEEFLMLLDEVDPAQLRQVGEQCCAAVRDAGMPLGLSLTISGGLTHVQEVNSLNAWLLTVDRRLYRAKSAGRDQIVVDDVTDITAG